MALRKRTIILRTFALFAGGVAILVVALPLWFPWLLRPVAKRWDLTYAKYEREGYNRFRLTGVTVRTAAGTFRAKSVNAFVPTAWLWTLAAGGGTESLLSIESWSFTHHAGSNQTASSSVYTNVTRLNQYLASLAKWAPRATLTNGTLQLKGEALAIPQIAWVGGNLSAEVAPPGKAPATLSLSYRAGAPLELSFAATAIGLQSDATITRNASQVTIAGTINWLTNSVEFKADFDRAAVLPVNASLRADSLNVPARVLKLQGYQTLAGSLSADWHTNQFPMILTARAEPGISNLPPVNIVARASGDTNSLRLDTARISAPGLQAELSRETRILFRPPFLAAPSELNVRADLSQQSWLPARGTLTGRAFLRPGDYRLPQVSFALTASDVVVSNVAAQSFRLEGQFLWPRVEITNGQMETADGSQLDFVGDFDITRRTVNAGRINLSGGFGRQFLPPGFSFDSASLAAEVAGPLDGLTNSARLEIRDFVVPHSRPMDMQAQWRGRGWNLEDLSMSLAAGASTLQARGSADLSRRAKQIALSALDLSRSNQMELQLQQPVHASFQRINKPDNSTGSWSFDLEPFLWSGNGREVQLAANVRWPERGEARARVAELDTALIEDFVRDKEPDTTLRSLNLTAGWTNGPVDFKLDAAAEVKTAEQMVFTANANVSGGTNGVSVKQFSISTATQAVCTASGSLPIVLDPTTTNGVAQINPGGPLHINLTTEPESILWDKLSTATGLRLREPQLAMNLDGTWDAPQGHVTMDAAEIQFPTTAHRLPSIDGLHATLDVDPQAVQISRFAATIAGQPVQVTASVPLGQGYWRGLLRHEYLPDWREATGQFEITNAQLAPFADYLPDFLTPEGELNASITLEKGGELGGRISLAGARTRPLDNIGPIRDIQAEALLAGHSVMLTNCSASIGGQRVGVTGAAPLTGRWWETNGLPPFEIHLRGNDVPLVRNPSLLLRADLDLGVTNAPPEQPVVGGTVKLRDSLFLADLRSLVPEETASPKQRPPYFSVEEQPWADWLLQLNVQGDGFLRVQTPLFRGKVSTSMKLEGTLKSPLALGEVKIDTGSVTFPFGSLDVKQGLISLTSENRYQPRLYITAGAQRLGYDINMEVTGTAEQPAVQFSSTPPLNSEQIILMLTAGQVPQGIGASTTARERAQGLALFVGKNLLSEFGFGTGGQDRLIVRSGERISESGHPTYEAEYKLTDTVSLVGQYDRFDQYNLNLKWKAYSK